MIGKRGIMQTYSKFLGCLDLQHSSFQHYLDHQYLFQCKDTVLDCLRLQNSRQQLIKNTKEKTFISSLIMKNCLVITVTNSGGLISIKIYRLAMELLPLGIDIRCKGLCQHLHRSSHPHQSHIHHDCFHHHTPHHLSSQG